MAKVLFVAQNTLSSRNIFISIQSLAETQLIDYNYNSIISNIQKEKPIIILFSVTNLLQNEIDMIEKISQQSNILFMLIGNSSECSKIKEIIKNITCCIFTPATTNEIVRTLKSYLPGDAILPTYNEFCTQTEAAEQKKVLVVDDDVVFLRTMTNYLKDRYKVLVAKSGTSAIALLGKEIPDLILLDYEMPVMDGAQTFQLIRSEKQYEKIPIFFLTGQTDPQLVKQILLNKPEGYILKSSGKNVILGRVDSFFAENK